MERLPEPELMNDMEQAEAYALADFEEPHAQFVALFAERFPEALSGCVLDLGCGPADITLRMAERFPACSLHGVDAAEAMLGFGRAEVERRGVGDRVELLQGYLPGAELPRLQYDAVISNSLLHHLQEPAVLWEVVKQYGAPEAPVFVMDLLRPPSEEQAAELLERYAADEPEVLRRDFYNSLLAAYLPSEVSRQLVAAGLDYLSVEQVSDRHLLVWGHMR